MLLKLSFDNYYNFTILTRWSNLTRLETIHNGIKEDMKHNLPKWTKETYKLHTPIKLKLHNIQTIHEFDYCKMVQKKKLQHFLVQPWKQKDCILHLGLCSEWTNRYKPEVWPRHCVWPIDINTIQESTRKSSFFPTKRRGKTEEGELNLANLVKWIMQWQTAEH